MEECSICLNNLNIEVAELECGHIYHFACIDRYRKFKRTILIECPLCRRRGRIIDIYDIILSKKVFCETIYINDHGVVVNGKSMCCGMLLT